VTLRPRRLDFYGVPSTRLNDVLWVNGASGVGKTTAARQIAWTYDLRLYSLDSQPV
jgi:tRNA A37 N6-isopentenylltransferase MiaA